MSGFERSAPIPGSQGPRRSTMQRINNAPPPMTPWRQEVLEAQRQAAEAARRANGGKSRSRSRSRSRHRRATAASTLPAAASGAGGSSSSRGGPSSRKKHKDDEAEGGGVAVMKDALLRHAKDRGEGWYAAVAKASEVWEEQEKRRKLAPPPYKGKDKSGKEGKDREKDREKERRKDKDKSDRHGDNVEEVSLKAKRREEDEQERKWKAEAEAREKRLAEERQKAEEERKRKEAQEKQRKSKLSGAFAMDSDGSEEEVDRTAKLAKGAAERKRGLFMEVAGVPAIKGTAGEQGFTSIQSTSQLASRRTTAVAGPTATGAVGGELGTKLGFDGCSDPAEAFMRLQERKRKGRRSEFGGPPRGCSPWRDGKKGVSFAKDKD